MARPLELDLSPVAVLARWPAEWPLAALWSGDPDSSRSRWTVLARPSRSIEPSAPPGPDVVRRLLPPSGGAGKPAAVPFTGGWIGVLSYDVGRLIEPSTAGSSARASAWPAAQWARCDDAVLFDHAESRWWAIGDESLATALAKTAPGERPWSLGPLASRTGRARYTAGVERALEYIRAGDIYQVNLAHRLDGDFSGSSRSLFAELALRARPWYGAYLEPADGRAILSLSPELFLNLDPVTRLVETRPMKGTRRATADPRELELAQKDRAELNMIIDLQRNDLGRVCDFGSVRVEQPREIERHGRSLLQATATVTGRLRAGLGPAELIAAAFPGGSITGVPKIRAMQIIDELECEPRGPYCGAIGWLGDDGRLSLNIAIRTALIEGNRLSYPVGAGIVADSDPEAEWRETLDKAAVLGGVTTIDAG